MTDDDKPNPFPPPPMAPRLSNRAIANSIPVPPGLGPITYTPPSSEPPATPSVDKLTENEVSMILRTSLTSEHHRDPKVITFISNYLRCRNAAQAAKEAGLNSRDGIHLRNKPDIHLAITKFTEKAVMKYGFDADEIVERLKEIAGLDPLEFENPDGTFKLHMRDIAPEARRAIKKFKARNTYEKDPNGMDVITGQIIEVEYWDKMKAVEFLGREKDLFKETTKVQHDVTKNMASVLLDSKRRADDHNREMKDVIMIEASKVTEE